MKQDEFSEREYRAHVELDETINKFYQTMMNAIGKSHYDNANLGINVLQKMLVPQLDIMLAFIEMEKSIHASLEKDKKQRKELDSTNEVKKRNAASKQKWVKAEYQKLIDNGVPERNRISTLVDKTGIPRTTIKRYLTKK